MIWNSIIAMTAFDILIVGCVVLSIAIYYVRRHELTPAWSMRGSIAFMSGMAAVGLFYAADLGTMHLIPYFTQRAETMRLMEYLHLNVEWFSTSVAVICLAAGLLWLSRTSGELVSDLRKSQANLSRELERHKQSHEALSKSEERFTLAVRGTNDGIWDWNIETNDDYFSPRWKEILGYADDELEPHFDTFADLIHPDDRNAVWQAAEDHLAKRGPYDLEMRLRHKSGEYVWVRARGQAVWNDDGAPVRMAGSISDITENKRMDQTLRDSEARLANAQRIAHLGNWDWDIVANTLWWSDEIYRIFGLAPHQFAANYEAFLDAVHPDDRGAVQAAVASALAGSAPYAIEHRIVLPDGSIRIVHERAEVVVDDTGCPIRMSGTVHDITERKKTETQLAHSQKMESVGRLTGGVAHDFNNLLTVVIGNLELLLARTEDVQSRNYIARAMKSSKHGAELTQQLLAYSRRQALIPTVVNVNDMVTGISGMLSHFTRETVKVRTRTAPDLWRCKIDPSQFESALMNLATNANDAMPSGGILTIQTDNVNIGRHDFHRKSDAVQGDQIAPGDYVRITVSDTGHGMPDEILKQATEPFFTTKAVGQGSGLGLSMVYGLIKQSGGDMLMESEIGAGTTISLFLPRHEDVAEPRRSRAGEFKEGRGERVLLVEDDANVRELTSELLRDMGYAVQSATTGEEAVAFLNESKTIDLLLSDIVLTGHISGIDLAREVAEKYPHIKVVLMSGYAEEITGSNPEEVGNAQFIAKPFERDDLGRALHNALASGNQRVRS